MFSGLVP